jgi:predicted Fe-Mo cluster-binding NifX family protein
MNGTGMFKSFKLAEIRSNPRNDLDHEHEDEEGSHDCSHSHDDAEHIAQHDKMGRVLEDCNYIVVSRACKNTVNSMKNNGVSVVKYNGNAPKADAILREVSVKFV